MLSQQENLREQVEGTQNVEYPFRAEFHNIASQMVDATNITPDQRVLIWYDEPGLPLVSQLYSRCQAKGVKEINLFRRDLTTDVEVFSSLPDGDPQLATYFDEEARLIRESDTTLIVRAEDPRIVMQIPPERKKMYADGYADAHRPRLAHEVAWNLFLFPTEFEAANEGIPYDEYLAEIIEACDQPWKAIEQAQQKLVDKLNAGRTLTLIANQHDEDPKKRTFVTMSIDGMTFVNSTTESNFPGSEVFSAPEKYSVNGQIYAAGNHVYKGYLMKDIFLRIENGKIVEAHADEGNEGLQDLLNRDEGARYFGEVALGTNPGMRRLYTYNGLLREKFRGSFHMAAGSRYKDVTIGGVTAHVDNGNESKIHWDITVPMIGDGMVIVDDEVIQENGDFLDPDFAILNRPAA